jgi:hypothetical protein
MTITYKEIRAWGVDNGYKCRTGKLGQNVVAAYAAEHPDAVIADLPAPFEAVPDEPEVDEGPEFTCSVVMEGHEDAALAIEGLLVNALFEAFTAGRAAERADLLARLSGDAA